MRPSGTFNTSSATSEDRVAAKELFEKLYRSEKRVMLKLGLAPKKKNRTGTLLHYLESLYPSEQEKLIEIINKNTDLNVHAGTLPFVNRSFVLSLLGKICGRDVQLVGTKGEILFIDEMKDADKVNWKELESSKTFRAKSKASMPPMQQIRPKQGKR